MVLEQFPRLFSRRTAPVTVNAWQVLKMKIRSSAAKTVKDSAADCTGVPLLEKREKGRIPFIVG
jgi:hypothetical protein